MNNAVPTPPPFAATPIPEQTGGHHHSAGNQTMLVVASAGVGAAVAVPTGGLLGWLVIVTMTADCYGDGWCELGAAVFGALAGIAIGLVAYLVAGAMLIRKRRPAGKRWLPTLIHCAIPVALGLLFLVMAGL